VYGIIPSLEYHKYANLSNLLHQGGWGLMYTKS